MSKTLEIYSDGASRGNPGVSAIGVVIKEKGKVVKEISQGIGEATNNVAEYTALIYALQESLVLKADQIKVHTDSELLFNQLKGTYKVKNEKLKLLYSQLQHLAKGFKKVEMKLVPREKNREADRLASQAIKKEQAKVVAPTFRFS